MSVEPVDVREEIEHPVAENMAHRIEPPMHDLTLV